MTIYPKASKIIKPPSLRPIRTDTTDIRKTFAAARRQMAAAAPVVQVPPLVVDRVEEFRPTFPVVLPFTLERYKK